MTVEEIVILIQIVIALILPAFAHFLGSEDEGERKRRDDKRENFFKSQGKWRVYLAAPYSHENPEVREARAKVINQKCAKLMLENNVVFSPITHSHALVDILPFEERTWSFFKIQDFSHLSTCHELRVFCLPEWENSVGVQEEIKMAHILGLKIVYDNYYGKLLYRIF